MTTTTDFSLRNAPLVPPQAYTPPVYAPSVLELFEHRKHGLLRLMYGRNPR